MPSLSLGERYRKAQAQHYQGGQTGDSSGFQKWEQKARSSKKGVEVAEVLSRILSVRADGTGIIPA